MRRLLPILALTAVLATATSARGEEAPAPMTPELARAAALSDTWTQDYAAAVGWAQAAMTAERPEDALAAWDRAMALSGGNLEVLLGRSATLLVLDRVVEARLDARGATALAPDLPAAWNGRGRAQRHAPKLASGAWGLLDAEASYARALTLDPEHGTARCGLAWTRLALGDRLGAQRAFQLQFEANPSNECAARGAVAAAPQIAGGGAVVLAGVVRDGHPLYAGGLSLLVQGGLEVADLAFLQVTGRFLWLFPTHGSGAQTGGLPGGPPGGPGTYATPPYDQQEIWVRAGASHRGSGGQALVGIFNASTADDAFATVGGQGWLTVGATLRGEGTFARYADGDTAMGGLGVRVPVTSFLSLDGGLRLSWWLPETGEDEGPLVAGQASALLDVGPLELELGGRFGSEVRPLRFEDPTLWNTTERYGGGLFVDGALELHENIGLTVGYELLRMVPTDGSDDRHTHVFSLGVSGQGIGGLRR